MQALSFLVNRVFYIHSSIISAAAEATVITLHFFIAVQIFKGSTSLTSEICGEYVGAKIPSKWQRFVGVRSGYLEAIQASKSQWLRNCFTQVFDKWHNGMTSPYTWVKVAEALESVAWWKMAVDRAPCKTKEKIAISTRTLVVPT